MALPIDVACGASTFPILPVSTRTAWRASRTDKRDDAVALQRGEMHRLAGRLVDRFRVGLRPARQIDLQAGMPEIDNARPERVESPSRHLRRKAAVNERCQQMMAGRNVEAGAVGEIRQRRFTARFGDGLEQKQSAIDGLDAVTVTLPRARGT